MKHRRDLVFPRARSSASWSRTSPRTTRMRSISPEASSSDRGTQSRIRHTTSAPPSRSRRTSHDPTNPVAPVTNTGRSRQNDGEARAALFPGVNVNGLRSNGAARRSSPMPPQMDGGPECSTACRADGAAAATSRRPHTRPYSTANGFAAALLDEIGHVERRRALRAALDDIPID